MDEHKLNVIISRSLHEFGIPANYSGYRYLRSMIADCVNNFELTSNITKVLYVITAEKFSKLSDSKISDKTIERCSRHAIQSAGHRYDFLVKKFGHIPTNSEFIATIADDIKMEYNL